MAELTKAASDYLQAVDKKKKVLEASGGRQASANFTNAQKAEGKRLDYQKLAKARLKAGQYKGPMSPFDPKKDYYDAKPQITGRGDAATAYRNRPGQTPSGSKVDGMKTYRDRTNTK